MNCIPKSGHVTQNMLHSNNHVIKLDYLIQDFLKFSFLYYEEASHEAVLTIILNALNEIE
jgi:hypothetical protein